MPGSCSILLTQMRYFFFFFFLNDTAPTEIYPLPLHDAFPILGRAIVREPKVFLFDEPLSNLDAKLRVQMRTEIKKLRDRVKTTAIYVTHDQVEAMTLARSEEHTSELQSPCNLVCRLLLEKKKV